MTAISKQRLYKAGGNATVAVTTALFASPFILVALFLIERATGQG
jgi:hypothetical protein